MLLREIKRDFVYLSVEAPGRPCCDKNRRAKMRQILRTTYMVKINRWVQPKLLDWFEKTDFLGNSDQRLSRSSNSELRATLNSLYRERIRKAGQQPGAALKNNEENERATSAEAVR